MGNHEERYPATNKTAFSCPHCGAFTSHTWHKIYGDTITENETPTVLSSEYFSEIQFEKIENTSQRERFMEWARKASTGKLFFISDGTCCYDPPRVENLHISSCFSCKELSLWIHDRIIWPVSVDAPPANPDMPDEVQKDYDEAARILNLSPRGASALLRLCVQRLCIHLGASGKNINNDIQHLSEKGLDERVRKALDVVRVLGNNAVHPGQLDIKDDRSTALSLCNLINIICDIMISQPKHIQEMYESLPESSLHAIERRKNKPT